MPKLPSLETFVYFLIWTGSILYSIFCFSKAAFKFLEYNNDYLVEGWSILERPKDDTDVEWKMIKYIIQLKYKWVFSQIFISEMLRRSGFVFIKYKKKEIPFLQIFQILFTFSFILNEFGLKTLFLLIFQPLFFVFIMTISNSIAQIWIYSSLLLVFLEGIKDEWFHISVFGKLNDHQEENSFIIVGCAFWMFLKGISYTLNKQKENKKYDLIEFFSYCLYLPTLCYGPFILFDDHVKCLEYDKRSISEKFSTFFFNFIRFLFWMIFIEFSLHYIYVNEVLAYPEFVEGLKSWELYGYGYTMSQFFHLKYVVCYGLSTTIAKFDNISAPRHPKCIGRIHIYSDMWRTFDVGLYKFLTKYIYIPTIKSKYFHKNKYLASFFCFVFVFLWHGVAMYIFIWALLNYIGIVIEMLAAFLDRHFPYLNKWGPHCKRKIVCALAAPLLAMSALSNFYFFSNIHVGNTILYKTLEGPILSNIFLLGILYCCCQVSTSIKLAGF